MTQCPKRTQETRIFYIALGHVIRQERRYLRLLTTQFCLELGMDPKGLSLIERGIKQMKVYQLHVIARMLDLEAQDLIDKALAYIADHRHKIKEQLYE